MPRLTDDEIVSICEAELDHSRSEGDLSDERSKSMDYYMGDMADHVKSVKNRSNVVTRDVLDTVESVLPSLMRIFVEADNAVEFEPANQADEKQCKQETDAVRSVFYDQNEGFLVLYSFIKDALISKNGIIKSWWEDPVWEREEYKGLDDMELEKLLLDDSYKYEIIDGEQTEEGMNVTLKVQRKKGSVHCEVVTPEEFGISRDASSPNPKDAGFCYHQVQKTVSDLIEAGHDRKLVEELPDDTDADSEERLARRNLSDEQDTTGGHNASMRTVWVTECYIRADRDDDGIAELLKVTLASVGAGSKLLDIDEVDRIPFVAASPVVLTHKFYGMSLADLVSDIQEIRTVLMRGILDNMYLANNVRMGVNENVNLDDLLTSRPGGVVRTKGKDNPAAHMTPIVHPPVPGEAFGLLEVLDDMMKQRTGVGDEVMGLDSDALANINTGVIAQAYDAARMRIELMARIIAEIGLKELFQDIHELLHKNQDESFQIKVGDTWIDVDPAHWREGRKCKVVVGLGHHSRERKLMAVSDIMQLQQAAREQGYEYVQPQHIHNAITDRIEAHGMQVDKYFADPSTFQPPEKGPSPQEQFAQAQLMLEKEKLGIEQQKLMVSREKNQIDGQVKLALAASKERESELKMSMEGMKGEMDLQRMAVNEQSQVMQAQTDTVKSQFDIAMREREQDWKEYKEGMSMSNDSVQTELEKYKADLQAATQLETKLMDIQQQASAETMKHIEALSKMMLDAEQKREGQRASVIDWIENNGSGKAKELAAGLK